MKSQHCWEITDRLPKINDNDLLETFGKDFFLKVLPAGLTELALQF